MGGGIALLILGTLLAWMVGGIPFYALITALRPVMFVPLRILLAVMLAALMVVLVWWASSAYQTPWILLGYIIFMAFTNVVAVVLLIVRFFMRRG